MEPKTSEEDYKKCAQRAHELFEIAGMTELAGVLAREKDHAYACNVGIWFWSLGHKNMAKMCYERSIELKAEGSTYYNLAVCCDDLGNEEEAIQALRRFYEIVDDKEEIKAAENLLMENGKHHLIQKVREHDRINDHLH